MYRVPEQLKRIIAHIALLSYVSFGVLGFFHLIHMEEMSIPLEHCPFMHMLHDIGQGTMTHNEQMIALPFVTIATLLQIVLIFSLLFVFATKHILIKKPLLHLFIFIQKYRTRLRYYLYQSLFSQGLLHTKVF